VCGALMMHRGLIAGNVPKIGRFSCFGAEKAMPHPKEKNNLFPQKNQVL